MRGRSSCSHAACRQGASLSFLSAVLGGLALVIGASVLARSAPAQVPSDLPLPSYGFPNAVVVPPAPQAMPLVQGPIVEPILVSPGLDIAAPQPVSVEGISWLPDYMDPTVWFSPVFWDGTLELGINGQDGLADTFSLQTGFELSRETERTNLDVDFTYAKTEAGGVETQNNAFLWTNWDYKLGNPRWSWFNKLMFEYDAFKDFDLRFALSTGLGYLLIDNDTTELRGRLGGGTSREFDSADDAWKPEAIFGCDFAQQLTARQKLSASVDYFPNVDDFSDYRIVLDAGWELILDQETNLSLKLGVIDRYDSTSGDAEPNILNYSLLLLWTI